jgi:hypothetical protein
MTQVHKETLTTIENALPNRSNLDVEIFGMEGIPDDVVSSHNQRVLSQFAQAEADRRAATGNSGPGGSGASAAKKPKVEDPSDLKKRLAEHKAKKAAEAAAGISSGDATPIDGTHGSQSPAFGQNPGYVSLSIQTRKKPTNIVLRLDHPLLRNSKYLMEARRMAPHILLILRHMGNQVCLTSSLSHFHSMPLALSLRLLLNILIKYFRHNNSHRPVIPASRRLNSIITLQVLSKVALPAHLEQVLPLYPSISRANINHPGRKHLHKAL